MDHKKANQFVAFARWSANVLVWADWRNIVFNGVFAKFYPSQRERVEFVESIYQREIEEISKSLRQGKSIPTG